MSQKTSKVLKTLMLSTSLGIVAKKMENERKIKLNTSPVRRSC